MALPSHSKLKGFTSKYILKKAMENCLPDEVVKRQRRKDLVSPLRNGSRDP